MEKYSCVSHTGLEPINPITVVFSSVSFSGKI